jgi:hypothetical protein
MKPQLIPVNISVVDDLQLSLNRHYRSKAHGMFYEFLVMGITWISKDTLRIMTMPQHREIQVAYTPTTHAILEQVGRSLQATSINLPIVLTCR